MGLIFTRERIAGSPHMKEIWTYITRRWNDECGYRRILVMAFPLILSTSAWAIQHFVDRMFLTWHSPEAIAASMPAGMLSFTIMSLFIGTANYVTTFVAQYHGAGRDDRIGPSVWQGIYVALIAGVVHLLFIPAAAPFFQWVGHGETIQEMETIYFQILCLGALPQVASGAFSGFFAGRGKTSPVMWVNIAAMAVNLILDYALIFGHFGFPALGVKGAAIATALAPCASCAIFLILLAPPRYEKKYRTLSGWRLDIPLFARIMRYGLPNGMGFLIEMIGFTAFILLVGRLGTIELAATNVAFNINNLAFLPMIGFGTTISILVGQSLGRDRVDLATRSVYSGAHLTFFYMISIAAAYAFIPGLFLWPFAAQADATAFAPIREMSVVLLKFVAAYCFFDTMNIIFSAGIKGAGDTRFAMYLGISYSIFGLAIPTYIILGPLGMGIYAAWTVITLNICLLGLIFFARFLGGKWKEMRVIEATHPTIHYPAPGKQDRGTL